MQAKPIPPELDYPNKPVRVIEPFGAGGGVEVLALAVTEKLSDLWDPPVMVENHPGAGGTSGPGPGGEVAGRYALSPHPRLAPSPRRQAPRSGRERRAALARAPRGAHDRGAGVAGFDYPIWHGIWAPAGTRVGVVQKLAQDIGQALSEPDLPDWFVNHGAVPVSMTQADFARFVLSESAARRIEAGGDQARIADPPNPPMRRTVCQWTCDEAEALLGRRRWALGAG